MQTMAVRVGDGSHLLDSSITQSILAYHQRGVKAKHIAKTLEVRASTVKEVIAQASRPAPEPLFLMPANLGPAKPARLLEDSPVEVALQALSAARPPEYVAPEESVDGRAGVVDRGKHRPRREVDNIGPDGRSMRF